MQWNSWPFGQGSVPAFDIVALRAAVHEVRSAVGSMVLRRPTKAGAGPQTLPGYRIEDCTQSAMALVEPMPARVSNRAHEALASNGRA